MKIGIKLKFILIPIYAFIAAVGLSNCEKLKREVNVIPKPLHLEINNGFFIINEKTRIVVDSDEPKINSVAEYFINQLNQASGFSLSVTNSKDHDNAIIFSDRNIDESLGKEGYFLLSKKNNILASGTPNGLFYSVQTLFQLLPQEIFSSEKVNDIDWRIPYLLIKDAPRFKWRGMHLDVGRHMFPVPFIKKYIDYIAMHKLNTFHWHLTEDQGWRIEIKKYPLLTKVGAWRKGTTLAKLNKPDVLDGITYGGFYSQEDIREIVAYAKERFVTIVPEIELPGHSLAALTSYPKLSCTGGPFEVRTNWGIDENIYCAGNDSVFLFLENVLNEVIELFPSEYIHIGGDEAPKVNWEKCSKCQKRIKKEGLKDEKELQSYFITRIEKFLNSKGRKIIGWDEILEGGLAPNAAVMSWRGIDGGIEAAKQKHNVVMSPTSHCYFDYYQAAPENEPRAIGGLLPLEKVYNYEPVPDELNQAEAKFIMGLQANVWTEYITTPEKVEYMALPRMSALAEVAWSSKENKNLEEFLDRMNKHYERLDLLGVNYSWPKMEMYNNKNVFIDEQKVEFTSKRRGTEIRYTLDGGKPNRTSQIYSNPFYLSETSRINVIEIANNGKVSPIYTFDFIKQTPLKPINIVTKNVGLKFAYYEFEEPIDSSLQLLNMTPIQEGEIKNFIFPLPDKELAEIFGIIFKGYLEVKKEDVYTFSVLSNDGSRLYVAENLVVLNDGWHGAFEKEGSIALQPGKHAIKLLYFQVGGSKELKVFVKNSLREKEEILGEMLSH